MFPQGYITDKFPLTPEDTATPSVRCKNRKYNQKSQHQAHKNRDNFTGDCLTTKIPVEEKYPNNEFCRGGKLLS